MDEGDQWAMDRLAASNLLTSLGLASGDERLAMATRHFAGHRRTAMEWAAKQAHVHVIRKLEAASGPYFTQKGPEWSDGFRAAEHEIATIMPHDMLDLPPKSIRGKGQILRALLRDARRRRNAPPLA